MEGIDFPEFIKFVLKKQASIRKLIRAQLKNRLEANFKIGPGLLKLLSHVQDDRAFTKAIFGTGADKEKQVIIKDLCILEDLIQTHFKNYEQSKYQGFKNSLASAANFKATCDELKEKMKKFDLYYIAQFPETLLSIRFVNLFDVFDKMEIQTKAKENGSEKAKNLQMQPEAISYLVKNFFTMYRMSAQWRITTKTYEKPIQTFMNSTEDCLKKVEKRGHSNLLTDSCPFNNLHYHDIFVLMKYVRVMDDRSVEITKTSKPKQFSDFLNQDLLRNNSTMALFLLLSNQDGEISGSKVCEIKDSVICTEFELFSRILQEEGNHLDFILKNIDGVKK